MGYQFLHIESYGRTAGKGKAGGHTIASIVAEASREPAACPHVEHPKPPTVLFGCPLDQIEGMAEEWADTAKDGIGRKLRKDGLCLLSGVISAPDDLTDEQWESFKSVSIGWLNRDGRLISVVEHTDESHRHIHFYKIPASGQRFESLHPGQAAAIAVKLDGGLKGDQNKAYKEAMRRFQDDFFENVAVKFGLTRLGPKKRRLTRSEWRKEQQTLKAYAFSAERAEQMKVEALALAEESKIAADKAEALKVKADKAMASNSEILKKAKKETAVIEQWNKKGKAFGVFLESFKDFLFADDERKKEISDLKKKLRKEKEKAQEQERRAKRAELERDVTVEKSSKLMRLIEEERDQALSELYHFKSLNSPNILKNTQNQDLKP